MPFKEPFYGGRKMVRELFSRKRKAQGAIEYLLMLAAVLVIVAVAIYYVTGATPSATITGSAELESGDNTTVIFTPGSTMTPKTIDSADWEWAVYHGGSSIGSGSGENTLERGIPVSLSCDSAAQSGDEVKIKYKDTWYDAATVA